MDDVVETIILLDKDFGFFDEDETEFVHKPGFISGFW